MRSVRSLSSASEDGEGSRLISTASLNPTCFALAFPLLPLLVHEELGLGSTSPEALRVRSRVAGGDGSEDRAADIIEEVGEDRLELALLLPLLKGRYL